MTEIDETIREFLVESFENLDQLDRDLMELEVNPTSADVINRIFRIVHTIKGTCGFFEFKYLEAVSHVGENLLDSLRDNKIAVTQDIVSALLQLGDALKAMLLSIEETGNEGNQEYTELKALLTELNVADNEPNVHPVSQIIELNNEIIEEAEEERASEVPASSPEVSDLEAAFIAAQNDYVQSQKVNNENSVSREIAAEPLPTPPAELAPQATKAGTQSDDQGKRELAETSLRVDINLLDKLMNLVGELVLARNQILQFTKNQTDGDFVSTSQRLNLITSELQEGVMRTRMQPIANVWNKLPRIVRDISHSCGKQVRLEMHGKETELDKTIIEAIKDPLTHIIRNAVDHGIELPEVRRAHGKNPEGVLAMKAYHEGGQVIIEISDDGAGLKVERIKAKAIEKGVVSAEKVARMNEQEIQRLIFLPGFSTADKVTNISGRGVGMDVVRTNIERIGGTVDVSNHSQGGTIFTIKIPLTLAIIPGLIVTAASNRYAIPQVNLLELVRVEGDQITEKLEEVHGAMFYRLRGKLLPIVQLRNELRLESKPLKEETVLNIVVVRADNHQFGLIVDAIYDTEEIVVKPLGKLIKNVAAFAGATIMGDGQVALILDVVGLARNAQITKEDALSATEEVSQSKANASNKRKLLIFQLNDGRRAAIPLEDVHRLEEFSTDRLESAAGHVVVQYRNGILPLVDLQEALCGESPEYNGTVRAFVHQHGDRYVGFIVKRILDIVEDAIKIESPYQKSGLVGSAIIQDVVTDIVDLNTVLTMCELSQ